MRAHKNSSIKIFEKDDVFVCPAGIKQVMLQGYEHDVNLISMNYNSALVDQSGVVYAFGKNANGQLGDNSVVAKSAATLVAGSLVARQVVTNEASIHILTKEGFVYSSGLNTQGNLGDNTVVAKSSPILVSSGQRFKKIASSGNGSANVHVMGLTAQGDLYGWGSNAFGQLGVNDRVARSTPTLVVGTKKWKDVYCSDVRTYAIDDSDRVYSWGLNDFGALGNGDFTVLQASSPTLVAGGLLAREIADASMITKDGLMYCWGNNYYGQNGDGTIVSRSSPVLVQGNLRWRKLASYTNNQAKVRYGITDNGKLYVWGLNSVGYFGNNTTGGAASSPVLISVLSVPWAQIVASGNENEAAIAAVTPNADSIAGSNGIGNVWVWGNDTGLGNLAAGLTGIITSPTQLQGAALTDIILGNIDREKGEIFMAVTPGQSYRVVVNDYIATFGGLQIGLLLKGIRVRY